MEDVELTPSELTTPPLSSTISTSFESTDMAPRKKTATTIFYSIITTATTVSFSTNTFLLSAIRREERGWGGSGESLPTRMLSSSSDPNFDFVLRLCQLSAVNGC